MLKRYTKIDLIRPSERKRLTEIAKSYVICAIERNKEMVRVNVDLAHCRKYRPYGRQKKRKSRAVKREKEGTNRFGPAKKSS